MLNGKSEDDYVNLQSTTACADRKGGDVDGRAYEHGECQKATKCCEGNIGDLATPTASYIGCKYV